MIYVYYEILFSHKKEQIWVSSSEVSKSRDLQSEVSQKQKNKYSILKHISGI